MPRRYLLGLLLLFGSLAAIYSLVTPLFEAPDEPWHYAYVRWLAEGHGLPRLDDNASGANQEVAQPPLYYAVAALLSRPVADDDLSQLFWHNPQFGFQAGGTVNDNKNMLIHTDRERFPWQGAVLAVRLARLASLAFGLLTVVATFGLTREALPDRPTLALVAAGAVAFTPQFLFISGVVSNDSTAAATGALALWALARIVRRGATPRRAAVAGLAIGLALLSKTSALLLLPLALMALWSSHRPTGSVKGRSWASFTILFFLAALVGGWWYARNWLLFDDPLGLSVHVNTPWGRATPASLTTLLSELPLVFRSFWGAFGWGHVELPTLTYLALGGLALLSGIGWLRILLRFRQQLSHPTYKVCLLAVLWCLGVLAALLRWMQQVGAPHGRLLFPALSAGGLLLTIGWAGTQQTLQSSSSTKVSVKPKAQYLPVLGLFLLSATIPFVVIRPAFARPDLLSSQKAIEKVTPQQIDYGERARLLGYRLESNSVTAGERVQVTLCWKALRPMAQDYVLFIHLLGRDNLRVAERTTYPGQGRFPTSLWPMGKAFCDAYNLQVAAWAPAPELYALEIGLYDAESGARLPARDASGQLLDPPNVDLVRVTPHAPLPLPDTLLAEGYTLDEQIVLLGYEGSQTLTPSGTLTLTLYWQALQAPAGDYKVFVHLLDDRGELVAQDDAPPRSGRYPTWAWQPGDLVPDPHQLTLPDWWTSNPDRRPPGPYRVVAGMYPPDTVEPLPVIGPTGSLTERRIPLGEIWQLEPGHP